MTNIPTEVLDKVRAALEALCAHLPLPTEGNYKSAEIHEEESFTCPVCDGNGEVEGEQFINFDNHALNVLFTGIGDEHVKWQKLFDALVKSAPQLREALTALEAALREPYEENGSILRAASDLLAAEEKLEEAELFHANCEECEGQGVPELCEFCMPLFDDARCMRREAIAKARALSATQPTRTGNGGEEWQRGDKIEAQFLEHAPLTFDRIRLIRNIAEKSEHPIAFKSNKDVAELCNMALLKATPPEPRNGWQPIESAPKDGEIIDLWEDGGRYPECWWSAQQWISYVTGTSGKKKEDHSYYVIENPTHWQPLPASPPCVGGKDG